MICLTAGGGPLILARIIRRGDGARRKALMCEGCVPKAPPQYAVLRMIDGEAA